MTDLSQQLNKLFNGHTMEEIFPVLGDALAFAIASSCETKKERLELYEIFVRELLDLVIELEIPTK